jgi:hypothetical protein
MKKAGVPTRSAPTKEEEARRKERLAAALRANLRKRKDQHRSRAASDAAGEKAKDGDDA